MTYDVSEQGVVTGEPIELWEFVFPNNVFYRYTTSINKFVTQGEVIWKPLAINRKAIKADSKKGGAPLTINAPIDFPPALDYATNSATRITINLYRTHLGDYTGVPPSLIGDTVHTMGKWHIAGVSFNDKNSVIIGGNISSLLATELPRFHYQFQCNHELYGVECGITEVFLNGTILGVDANDNGNITLSINAPTVSKLGVITVGNERRLITNADDGAIIKVIEPFEHLSLNDVFTMHDRGCNRDYNTCTSVFNNGNRFGGMPFIPVRNVFNGGF